MKNFSSYGSLAILTAFLMISSYAFSQKGDPSKWDKATADAWVKGKTWAPGLKPTVDPSVNSQEFAKQYFANKALWDKVFTFLEDPNLPNMKPGRYPIDGNNAYGTISDDTTKIMAKSNWEQHHHYIDLHYVIDGKEKIGGMPFTNIDMKNVVTPYEERSDIGYYKSDLGNYFTATPANFFLFFPTEAHRPHLREADYNKNVRKLVIKIRVAE